MAPNLSELATTTLANRTRKIRDNVTKNNAILMRLEEKGRIRTFDGGEKIYEELSYAQNANATWYSGTEELPVGNTETLTAAEFAMKLLAIPVVISGEEMLKNAGKEKMIDLLASRIDVAEATGANLISEGLYSDGTSYSGKQIVGLDAAVPIDPTTGTYGGINRATAGNEFWRSQKHDPASTPTVSTIQAEMNTLWALCCRGADRPDLIMSGGTIWATYMGSLQALQRFTGTETAKLGFPSVKYMDADVVLDGAIGGFATATTMYFLNSKYLHYRPHADRNMVPIGGKRQSVNQDATVEILGWAGNLTTSGSRFQGRLIGT